jgi:hypothetical protein
MPIRRGLSAIRIRADQEPTYIHATCRQELKSYPGLQNKAEMPYVLKCDKCDEIVGEWLTEAEKERDLAEWLKQFSAQ